MTWAEKLADCQSAQEVQDMIWGRELMAGIVPFSELERRLAATRKAELEKAHATHP